MPKRQGRTSSQCYPDDCCTDRSFISHGNLAPEIHSLIRRYDLNREEDPFEPVS